MKRDLKKHNRRSIRLEKYDYSLSGAYFLTICTQDKKCLFGNVADGNMQLSRYGEVVLKCWYDLPNHYPYVELDAFIIMPNHVHGIVVLSNIRAGLKPAPTKKLHGLSEITRAFKTFSSKQINALRRTPGKTLWQRNYFERVVRNEKELNNIREYIINNPLLWELDSENPSYKSVENKEKAPWED